jgi:hypothetical protein
LAATLLPEENHERLVITTLVIVALVVFCFCVDLFVVAVPMGITATAYCGIEGVIVL